MAVSFSDPSLTSPPGRLGRYADMFTDETDVQAVASVTRTEEGSTLTTASGVSRPVHDASQREAESEGLDRRVVEVYISCATGQRVLVEGPPSADDSDRLEEYLQRAHATREDDQGLDGAGRATPPWLQGSRV